MLSSCQSPVAFFEKAPIMAHMQELETRSEAGRSWITSLGANVLNWRWLLFGFLALITILWLNNTPQGLLGKADAIGYAVCHRIDARSFHLGERPLPLCVRCSGMYLGFMLGLISLALTRPRRGGMPSGKIWAFLGLLFAIFAVDGLNSYLHLFPNAPGLYEPNNILRLLTGTGVGLAIAVVIYPAFIQTAFARYFSEPVLGNWRQLFLLLGLGLLVDLLVLSENSLILYPLALISAGGVLVLLSMVYAMVWLMLLKRENHIERITQLLVPLAGGLLFAILQIVIIDVGRFILTGTWDGFHLG